jgi:hypothetical protein
MSRFVRPDSTRIEISGGDWLLVRSQLNAGEHNEVFARSTDSTIAVDASGMKGDIKIHPVKAGMANLVGYLIDWSLVDDDGRKVEIRDQPFEVVAAALEGLDLDSFQEIQKAITAHGKQVDERRDQEKKLRGGDNGSPMTLLSPVGAGGGTSG